TGTIERFDRRKNAFLTITPNNPFGKEIRERFIARTGHDSRKPLPNSALEPEDRISQSLTAAAWCLCREYHPQTLPVTPPEGRVEIADKALMSRLNKKIGLFFGAELVRITRVDQRWVYKDIDIPHEYAILLVIPHAPSFIKSAPSHLSGAAVADTYSRLKFASTQLADFICGLGYDAAYRETLGDNPEMLIVPTAIDAGVGEFARNGRVLSPEFGINMRIKPVTTSLPLETDKPIAFNVHDFCMACENCAIYCPAQAIPYGPPTDTPIDIYNNPGYRKWYINAEKCVTFWSINKKKWTSCGGRCMVVCPWSKPPTIQHNMVRWLAIHSPGAIKRMLVRADRTFYRRKKSLKV
ncbi:MAG: reductive dehalogenase domain-containing protein, partial [Chloroflexota bacterium]|nr:reductive dehalogenase domain-containing protein [Chloroflexota bacterium]